MPTKNDYHIDKFFKNRKYEIVQCYVDTDNYFIYNNQKYKIFDKVIQYRVKNKAFRKSDGSFNNFTNESKMDCIHVVELKNNRLHFFDQDLYRIHPSFIESV